MNKVFTQLSNPAQPMRNVTLKDIANETGVSISTVSLVLNGKGNLSKEVKERVYEAARKLEYIRPNYPASLVAKHTSHLAVLVYEDYEKAFEWNFIRQMIISLETVITRDHYYPVMIPVRLDQPANEIFEKVMLSRAGGLFSIHYSNAELFQQFEEQNIPVVLVNNSNFQNDFHTVCADDFQGAYEGTRHLLSCGHHRIGYIEYHRPDIPAVVKDRFAGFKTALEEAQIPFSDALRLTVSLFDLEELSLKLYSIFQHQAPPSALFIHDDYLAADVVVALQNMQLAVPADVSIIAPGDTLDYNQSFVPRITTMRINTDLIGTLAGEMMLRLLQHDAGGLNVLKVNQHLIDRGSCKQVIQ